MERGATLALMMLAMTASAAVDARALASEGQKTQWAPTRRFSGPNARAVCSDRAIESEHFRRPTMAESRRWGSRRRHSGTRLPGHSHESPMSKSGPALREAVGEQLPVKEGLPSDDRLPELAGVALVRSQSPVRRVRAAVVVEFHRLAAELPHMRE